VKEGRPHGNLHDRSRWEAPWEEAIVCVARVAQRPQNSNYCTQHRIPIHPAAAAPPAAMHVHGMANAVGVRGGQVIERSGLKWWHRGQIHTLDS
jgi:hypothetical protein